MKQLARLVARNTGLRVGVCDVAVRAVLEAIVEGVHEGPVKLRGFGTFRVEVTPARRGVNPGTGEKIQIGEKRRVAFRAGRGFVRAVGADR